MENIQRTIAGAYLQTTQLLGIPPNRDIILASSLNQVLKINDHIAITADDKYKVMYVGIGNGGHRLITGVGDIVKPEPVQHSPKDISFYSQLPFIIRPTSNALSSAEAAKYRLRKILQLDIGDYEAYYLKVIDTSEVVPRIQKRHIVNGITITDDFTFNGYAPVVPNYAAGEVLTTTGDYIATSALIPFTMTANDVDELLNVANILHGDEGYAIISEIGICSGIERLISGRKEAIGAQVISFINTFFSAKFSNQGINMTFDIGSVEPLLEFQS